MMYQLLAIDTSGGTNVTSTAAKLQDFLDGVPVATHLAIPGKSSGTNYTNSLLDGHSTTGTLNAATGNVGVGSGTLDEITSGDNNVAIGYATATRITTGHSNVAVGQNAMRFNTVGKSNVVMGISAGEDLTGDFNILIGEKAGDALTSGDGNVIIGAQVNADSNTGDGQLKIGTNANAGGSEASDVTWISGDNTGNLTFPADVTVGDDLVLGTDAAVLKFGADSEVTLTHVADDGLLLNTDMQLQFRDSAINIRSDDDGDLDINADDEIELNSTLIDINGNVEISGTATTTGVHTFTAVPVFPNNTIETADIQDNAITLAKLAGGTDGNIISFDASGDPVAIATGSDGQVLTSTGAGSPPAFETPAAGGISAGKSIAFAIVFG